jgi:hypothetical protein
MAAGDVQTRPVHSEQDRCFFCASDEEIATAMSGTGVRAILARVRRTHPTIHWQGYACPFEEA